MSSKTEVPLVIILVLDESGSMAGQMTQTISGFNEYIQQARKDHADEKVLITLVKFSDVPQVVYITKPIEDVEELTSKVYDPAHGGGTALRDAVGFTINEQSQRIDDEEGDVIFVTMTDGQEWSSKEFSNEQINDMITEKKKRGWSFVFLGADDKAWQTGAAMGFQASTSYDAGNMGATMQKLSAGIRSYRSSKLMGFDALGASENFAKSFDEEHDVPNIDMDKWEGIDSEDATTKLGAELIDEILPEDANN